MDLKFELCKRVLNRFTTEIGVMANVFDNCGNILLSSEEKPYICRSLSNIKCNCNECPVGLVNISRELVINGKKEGKIVVGPVLVREDFKKDIAEEFGVEEFVKKIKTLNKKEVDDLKLPLKIFSQIMGEIISEKLKDDRKVSELTILNKISKMVNSTLDLKGVLNFIMRFMVDITKAKDCSILLIEDNMKYCLNKENKKEMMAIEKILIEEIINSKNMVYIDNFKSDFRFTNIPVKHNAVVAFPLKIKDSISGSVNLYSDAINLKKQDLEFLSILIDQTAMAIENARQYKKIEELAMVDKLTGLYNRRHTMHLLEQELNKKPNMLAIALIDIDDFSGINNEYGHPFGDFILSEIAQIIKGNANSKIIGRYGGEEFIVAANLDETLMIRNMDKLRKLIEEKDFNYKNEAIKATVSIGVIFTYDNEVEKEELVKEADRALYDSKRLGKNRLTARFLPKKGLRLIDMNIKEFL